MKSINTLFITVAAVILVAILVLINVKRSAPPPEKAVGASESAAAPTEQGAPMDAHNPAADGHDHAAEQAAPSAEPAAAQDAVTELKITDVAVGSGAEAVKGKTVSVHYNGRLTNGQKFDSSYDRGTPFEFALGAGMVIPGWDQGIVGMKEGGKRALVIPPSLAYGERDLGVIPPNSTLVFDVELISVK